MATLALKPVPASQPHAADYVSTRTWLCVLGVLLGCFMAVLNIVLTNSSLRDIAGTLARIIREAPACVVLYDSFGENVLASVL